MDQFIGKTISHYKIIELAGQGGMGVVYKARDTKLKRTVAIKFLPSHLTKDKESRERFEREAQAAAALNHPNIVTVYEIGEYEDSAAGDRQIFISMEYVEGKTLGELLIENGELSIDNSVNIATQICEGLEKAHQAGIVHRDIKPGNIIIDKDSRVKILDFGLAKLKGVSQLTQETSTIGTIHYMSPEQVSGEEVDCRSDIWSLGVILFEMLTRQLPFKGEYDQAVIYSILNSEPEFVLNQPKTISAILQQVVCKCLVKKKEERFQNVGELLVQLRSIKDEQQLDLIVNDSPKKHLKKRKLAYYFLALTLFILLLVAGKNYLFQSKTGLIHSLAVLPFENLSGNAEQDYFSDGMTEEIITSLAQIKALTVISRTSVMRYKKTEESLQKIAGELHVDAIVEGSVLLVENQVRISAKLIEASTDKNLWAESYERNLTNILQMQRQVAKDIAEEIKINLTTEEQNYFAVPRSVNPEAYRLYLKGRFFWNKRTPEAFKISAQYFQEAIEKDSTYAPAYVGIADNFIIAGFYDSLPPMVAFPKAKKAVEKALSIDKNLAEAQTSSAYIKMLYDWDWPAAEEQFRKAIQLNPNYAVAHQWYSEFLSIMGRFDEAIREGQRAIELDPLSPIVNANLASTYLFMGQNEKAVQGFKNILVLAPDYLVAHFFLSLAYSLQGDYDAAISEAKESIKLSNSPAPGLLTALGYSYACSGKTTKAREILDQLLKLSESYYVGPFGIAIIYVRLGDYKSAFIWLEKAYEVRDHWIVQINVNPTLKNLRSYPEFTRLVQKLGFEN